MSYEEIHSGLPRLADDQCNKHRRIAENYHGEERPQYRKLFRLQQKINIREFNYRKRQNE